MINIKIKEHEKSTCRHFLATKRPRTPGPTMSKSFSVKEESDSSVVVIEFCETLKWVGLEIEKDCNFSLVLKLERSDDRWRGLGPRNPTETVLCDKFGSLRTTFDVVVVIIDRGFLGWELGETTELMLVWSFGVGLILSRTKM